MESQALSIIVYLFGNLFRLYLVFQFLKIFFKEQGGRREIVFRWIAFSLYYIINSMGFLLFEWPPIMILLSNVIGVFCITIFYAGRWKYRFIATAMMIAISIACEDIAYQMIVGFNIQHMVVVGTAMTNMLILFIVLLLQKFFEVRNGEDIFLFEWLSIVIIMGISIFISAIVFDQGESENIVVMGEIGLLILNAIVFYLFDHLVKLYRIQSYMTALSSQNQAYEKQLELLITSEENLASLRHDMRNHVMSLQQMSENGGSNEIKDYLNKMMTFVKPEELFSTTGDTLIDGLVNLKLGEAKAIPNVQIEYDIQVSNDLPIDRLDFSALLGNLFDNAIQALEKVDSEKYLKFSMREDRGVLMIFIENSHAENIVERNGEIITTKRDKKNHGIGLKNVKRIINIYDGAIKIEHTDTKFVVEAMLHIP